MTRATDSSGSLNVLSEEQQKLARIKFAILAEGLRLTAAAQEALFGTGRDVAVKRPMRTRSGVSGGLDLRLSDQVFVNAPVEETFAHDSPSILEFDGDQFHIRRKDELLSRVEPIPEPLFYSRRTEDDSEAMSRIAQMCSPDRLCYGMTGPACTFWPPAERCKFCSIGMNFPADARRKRDEHFYEVLRAALQEPHWAAQHVLLGGGTPSTPDMGATMAARLCRGVKRVTDISVYVMIAAPLDNSHIDALHDAGVDELGLNLEFWSSSAWSAYIPGKERRVGKARYLKALEHSAKLFGPVRTRSILIAGLEAAEETINGVKTLASIGVMPILSPFRPLAGTDLQNARGFSLDQYLDLYEQCRDIVDSAGLPLGPTCIGCQNNALALPFGDQYHLYSRRAP